MWIGGFLAIAAAPVATVAAWSVQPLDQDDVAQVQLSRPTATDRDGVTAIPFIVLFNHKRNLMSISDEDPMDTETRVLRKNIFHTIATFQTEVEPRVLFWDDKQCMLELQALPWEFAGYELARYFDMEPKGSFKSDLCRLCMIYKHGGYYFDTDILPIVRVRDHIGKDTTFATVVAANGKTLFQAFLAATPAHPLVAQSLHGFLLWYRKGKGSEPGALNAGPFLLSEAYKSWTGGSGPLPRVDHGNGHVSQFFVELDFMRGADAHKLRTGVAGLLQPSHQPICNYGVFDNTTQTVLMYSRMYDTHDRAICAPELRLLVDLSR